mmetsp:Transcript_43597/g.44107  ORF Transcript_43597/g.44107 Transcript_43597/m.44107 type:complete len:85 (+) Transcript_43597:89-343(+)|eukprot:CAMPEP_0171312510 /NCGR_PEP_ID=MMETSP0816-20121228/22727_1 /TAXON_ID=420281 /ORGANISM="Proboscia inermis, Strain CCAP1064/1" /LENGTH=84 /DNA_ID=CAMNT_0011797897 /DNA_START=104 /DNA_END=358 /DNA_ORIENTATION=-
MSTTISENDTQLHTKKRCTNEQMDNSEPMAETTTLSSPSPPTTTTTTTTPTMASSNAVDAQDDDNDDVKRLRQELQKAKDTILR